MMQCPKCGADRRMQDLQCPSCGVFYAKVQAALEKAEQDRQDAINAKLLRLEELERQEAQRKAAEKLKQKNRDEIENLSYAKILAMKESEIEQARPNIAIHLILIIFTAGLWTIPTLLIYWNFSDKKKSIMKKYNAML